MNNRRAGEDGVPIAPPSVSAVTLPELADSSAMGVLDGETRERERFVAQDFADLDLRSTTFAECAFDECRFDDADLRGTHFADCRWTGAQVAGLAAPRSGWRRVEIGSSRIGSAELYESDWHAVTVRDSKLGFLNFRGARVRDLAFVGCAIDELDLGGVRAERMSFRGCRIGTLELAGARLKDVDLRGADLGTITSLDGAGGAVIDETQLGQLAPLLARHLRLVVTD